MDLSLQTLSPGTHLVSNERVLRVQSIRPSDRGNATIVVIDTSSKERMDVTEPTLRNDGFRVLDLSDSGTAWRDIP
jgi:hypothetical protein